MTRHLTRKSPTSRSRAALRARINPATKRTTIQFRRIVAVIEQVNGRNAGSDCPSNGNLCKRSYRPGESIRTTPWGNGMHGRKTIAATTIHLQLLRRENAPFRGSRPQAAASNARPSIPPAKACPSGITPPRQRGVAMRANAQGQCLKFFGAINSFRPSARPHDSLSGFLDSMLAGGVCRLAARNALNCSALEFSFTAVPTRCS
jgi:hypothetical protein